MTPIAVLICLFLSILGLPTGRTLCILVKNYNLKQRRIIYSNYYNLLFNLYTGIVSPTVTQNGGKVSAVFLLIIAYRPRFNPFLNLAERLAGEDFTAFFSTSSDVVRYCTAGACVLLPSCPVDHG
jgi:hypothetical protein